MLDFFRIQCTTKRNGINVFPIFIFNSVSDIMIKGHDFYAVWDDENFIWSTNETTVQKIVDREIRNWIHEAQESDKIRGLSQTYIPMYMETTSSIVDQFHKYCRQQLPDNFKLLNQTIKFSSDPITKEDYASIKLPYNCAEGPCPNYEKIMSTLYSEKERHKIEWAIGSIIDGDSKLIQKFFVFYGAPGTGKSTVLNIIQKLFTGYWSAFNAKALGNSNDQFALEPFKNHPIVSIDHDSDLSRIESNTRLNSLISHENVTVNEKFKSMYTARFNSMLFIGTNVPVRITDSKSGLLRRLVDIVPTGKTLSKKEYEKAYKQIDFELGAIAYRCLMTYRENKKYYDKYIPTNMMGATNDLFNFLLETFDRWNISEAISLNTLWIAYKEYCEDAKVLYPLPKRVFKTDIAEYFETFMPESHDSRGVHQRNLFQGLKLSKFQICFEGEAAVKETVETMETLGTKVWLEFKNVGSKFDILYMNCLAQYASDEGVPKRKWDHVHTRLSDIKTERLHYVKLGDPRHIVIDFDIKGPNGEKSLDLNLKAANEFPPTYAELSKSGKGIHLHYIYTGGDPEELSRVYADSIEVKVFTGNSSLRRQRTLCNDLDIAEINSGLPKKKELKKMISKEGLANEKALRTLIRRNLNKEYHGYTKPSIDYIYSELEKAYKRKDFHYDVTDLRPAVLAFAGKSSNNANYCLEKCIDMKWKSEETSENNDSKYSALVFFDVEVFPNLFVVVYKIDGIDSPVQLINPTPMDIEELCKFRLIGFNNRKYDNHILYARMLGYTNEALYTLSQRIVSGSSNATFSEAYNLSYTDVYDFASAGNKMSLKKWEIELDIHHQELGLPWDKPVPEELWQKVADYCINDVVATEATFKHLKGDWLARQILADLAGMTVNDTTNQLTTRIIFGTNKKPQSEFNYRNLAEPVTSIDKDTEKFLKRVAPDMMKNKFVAGGLESYLPFFPGYKYEFGKSTYRGIEVGEGGEVEAEPGIHVNVALLDVMSMHPHSVIAECLFGVRYTERFHELVYGRVDIKHEDWDEINKLLDGKLTPYVEKVKNGELTSKELANALKTAINSVYGLTAAKFDNPFRDTRNIDNIVAKRGALFMVDLMKAVQDRGYTVAHIKTDSIKIPDADNEIIDFVMEFGKMYGYYFEHEATYSRMCLVNDAVYIAQYMSAEECERRYGYIPGDNKKKGGEWTATGTQFAVPYVFKTLFSKEPIEFKDLCETKTVTSSMYLDLNEGLADGEHNYVFVGRAGSFCPMVSGAGGGDLMREKDGKYSAVNGTKGYKWMEAETVKAQGLENMIDRDYYKALVDKAVDAINKYGDFFD